MKTSEFIKQAARGDQLRKLFNRMVFDPVAPGAMGMQRELGLGIGRAENALYGASGSNLGAKDGLLNLLNRVQNPQKGWGAHSIEGQGGTKYLPHPTTMSAIKTLRTQDSALRPLRKQVESWNDWDNKFKTGLDQLRGKLDGLDSKYGPP